MESKAEKIKKKVEVKSSDVEVLPGKVFVPAEVVTRLVSIINTYGNGRCKDAMCVTIDKLNKNEYGPTIVAAEIELKEDDKTSIKKTVK